MGLFDMAMRRVRKLIAWALAVVLLLIGGAGVWWLLNQAGMVSTIF